MKNFQLLKTGETALKTPINAYNNHHKHPRYLYLIGGVHGDEKEGVYVLEQLFLWLDQNEQSVLEDFSIVVIPVLNVDGHKKLSRVNSQGVDLNRNLPSSLWSPTAREAKYFPGTSPLSEKENQFLVELFESYPPAFIISMHSWYPVLNFNGNCVQVAEYLSQFNGYPIDGDLEGHPTPGSLGEFGPEKYHAPVLTMEFAEEFKITEKYPHSVSRLEIWKENEEGFKSLFLSGFLKKFLSELKRP